MEDQHPILENSTLEFVTILKQSFKIPFKNARFAIFLLISSIPLLFFMFLFELLLEKSIKHSLSSDSIITEDYNYNYSYNYSWVSALMYYLQEEKIEASWDSYQQCILLYVISIFPLHLLEFFTAFLTIHLSSKLLANDHDHSNISIQDTFSTNKGRLAGSFLTSIYVFFVIPSCVFGFLAIMINHYGFVPVFELIFLDVFSLLWSWPEYLELTAVLNVGLVVSVVDKVQGIGAMRYSFKLCKDKKKLGRNLMLVFFVLKWGVRIFCLVFEFGEIGVS